MRILIIIAVVFFIHRASYLLGFHVGVKRGYLDGYDKWGMK